MTNQNSFHSALYVLLIFAAIYFVALGIYELKKWISKKLSNRHHKKEDD